MIQCDKIDEQCSRLLCGHNPAFRPAQQLHNKRYFHQNSQNSNRWLRHLLPQQHGLLIKCCLQKYCDHPLCNHELYDRNPLLSCCYLLPIINIRDNTQTKPRHMNVPKKITLKYHLTVLSVALDDLCMETCSLMSLLSPISRKHLSPNFR